MSICAKNGSQCCYRKNEENAKNYKKKKFSAQILRALQICSRHRSNLYGNELMNLWIYYLNFQFSNWISFDGTSIFEKLPINFSASQMISIWIELHLFHRENHDLSIPLTFFLQILFFVFFWMDFARAI